MVLCYHPFILFVQPQYTCKAVAKLLAWIPVVILLSTLLMHRPFFPQGLQFLIKTSFYQLRSAPFLPTALNSVCHELVIQLDAFHPGVSRSLV